MKFLIPLVLAGGLFAQEAAKPAQEVTAAQLTYQRAITALLKAELHKAQILEARRNMAQAEADAQRLTEEYKLAESAALKAMGKSPDLYTFDAESGQARAKEKAAK